MPSNPEAWRVFYNARSASSAEAETLRDIRRLYIKCKENSETYLYDDRGSVVQLLQGGTVAQSYSYNAYGYINADEYGIQAPFYGYNGEQHDPATGLQYLRARYYAPQNGSFTTQDSFAGLLTDALSQNRYAYAQNNPVTFADPSGHSILGSIKNAYNAAKNTVTNAYNTVKSTVTSAYNAAKNTVTSAYNAVKNTVTSAYNAVKNTVTSAYNAVKNTVTGAYNAVKSTVTSAANTVSTAASSAAASVRNVCSSIASSPAANAVFQTLSDPYFALNDATGCMGLTPGVIQDFTESVGAFARHVCDAQMQHYTMQMEAQRAVDQATLNIFGDVMNAVGGWWDRNSSTLMRGISTTLIGISAIGVAAAAAPAATLIGGLAVVVAGGVAILGVTDIVLGSIDLTAAVFDDAEMRAFVNSPGYVTVEGGATLLSMVGSAALQPYVLLSDMMAKAAQANAAEAAQANAAEAARANEAEAAQADATAGNQAGTTGTPGIETKPIDELPDNVQATYNGYDRNGWKGNFSGQSRGTCAGGEYENRNGALPSLDNSGNPITYREFDVNNKIAGFDRDSERFVVGSDGSIYYTDSHYGGGTSPSGLPPFVKIDGG